jgi:hypothetical protein
MWGGPKNPSRFSSYSFSDNVGLLRLGLYLRGVGTMVPRWPEGSRCLFKFICSVFIEMVRWWLHLIVRARCSPSYPIFGGAFSAGGGHEVVRPTNLLWYSWFSCLLVWFQVCLFWSTGLIVGDGSCSGVFVLWSLSMTIFHLCTTTSFVQVRRWRGKTTARLRLMLVYVIVPR